MCCKNFRGLASVIVPRHETIKAIISNINIINRIIKYPIKNSNIVNEHFSFES